MYAGSWHLLRDALESRKCLLMPVRWANGNLVTMSCHLSAIELMLTEAIAHWPNSIVFHMQPSSRLSPTNRGFPLSRVTFEKDGDEFQKLHDHQLFTCQRNIPRSSSSCFARDQKCNNINIDTLFPLRLLLPAIPTTISRFLTVSSSAEVPASDTSGRLGCQIACIPASGH